MALALGNGSLLDGILMTASRHLSMLSTVLGSERIKDFGQLATEYKLRCVRELQAIISSSNPHDAVNDNTVASVLNLTLDEVSCTAWVTCIGLTSLSFSEGLLNLVNTRRHSLMNAS
jgi:hypothetical protein